MNSSVAFIDFETRSEVDIKTAGADVYARHPSTDVMCMAFCFEKGPVQLWAPQGRGELPCLALFDLFNHIRAGRKVVGHNIGGFDLQIWNYVFTKNDGAPELKIEQIVDTMAEAYAMALPGSLENAAAAVGLEQKKDMAGNRIMRQLSAPRAKGPCTECLGNQYRIDGDSVSLWNDMDCKHCNGTADETIWHTPESAPEKFERLYEYCMQDLEVTRELYKRLMRLSPQEQKLWQLDWKINQRGIQIDLPAVKSAIEIVKIEKERLDLEMREVTGNKVAVCNAVGQLKDFLAHRNVHQSGLAKADVLLLLADSSLPRDVRRALELRQEAAKTSTAKLEAMMNGACSDGRVRGTTQYHGAATGRWAGRRLQVHNLPKPMINASCANEILDGLPTKAPHHNRDMLTMLYGSPLSIISDCLRGFLIAKPGHELIAGDFSSIEARVLAWLAGQQSILDIFASHGKIYEHQAAAIYGVSINEITKADPRRQIGKVAVLALGYQGGKGAFQVMAKGYGVKVSDDEAEKIKNKWREANPAIVRFWYALEEAAIKACLAHGKTIVAGAYGREIQFRVNGSFLWCKLPSGRVLCYPYPKIQEFETPWGSLKEGLTYMGVSSLSNKWERQKTYGGSLAENVTQAVSRDLLAEAIFRLEENGHRVIMHVHDEVVIESPLEMNVSLKQIENIVSTVPAWAAGLPMSAEGFHGKRYRK